MNTRRVRLALGAVLVGAVAFSALAQQKPVGDIGPVDLKDGSKLFKNPGLTIKYSLAGYLPGVK